VLAWDAAVLLVVGRVEVAWAPNDICRVFFWPRCDLFATSGRIITKKVL
jgi:hypothetical protein